MDLYCISGINVFTKFTKLYNGINVFTKLYNVILLFKSITL